MYTINTFDIKTNEVVRTTTMDDLAEANRYVLFSNKMNALAGKFVTKIV